MLNNSDIKTVFYIALIFIVVSAKLCKTEGLQSDRKFKKGGSGTIGLFAFPRVGRSDPDAVDWTDNYFATDEYDEYQMNEVKRQGLVPFPRVGRSGINIERTPRFQPRQEQINTKDATISGMWFGPRLGRVQKRMYNKMQSEML